MPRIQDIIKRQLLKRGLVISRPPGQFNITEVKLANAKRRGLNVRCALDGGAAEGGWLRMFKSIYPDAEVICVEPRPETQDGLKSLARQLGKVHLAQTLLGPANGKATFNLSRDQSSMLNNTDNKTWGTPTEATISTIDSLAQQFNVAPIDLIKLDLQGYELQALAGATETLKKCQAVLLEVTFIPFLSGMPVVADVIDFMSKHEYALYDIAGLWHRPLDGAMGQGDFMFIREDHPLIADHRWNADGGSF